MPLLKKEESLPKRNVITLIYGEPGIGKTSLLNTAEQTLLVDFDRGVDRSINRQDTLFVSKWEDVQDEERAGTFKNYKTVGIDTAKAALDDFLMAYAIRTDFSAARNKLKAYGAIGDEFKLFVNNRRAEGADLVIIAHSKDEKEGDLIKKIPDVTGQSYNLLLRIADQVGYMKTINNKRTIQWEPSDNTIGKNVARLGTTEIPDESDPAFKTFMAQIISTVKDSICKMSEAQQEALEKMEVYKKEIESCDDPEELTQILAIVSEMPPVYAATLRKLISKRAGECGFQVDKRTKSFIAPEPVEQPEKKAVKANRDGQTQLV